MRALLITTLMSLATAETFSGLASPSDSSDAFNGNCGLMDVIPAFKSLYVSLNLELYAQGINCGRCIEVQCTDERCQKQPKLVAQVANSTPGARGDVSLSNSLFNAVTGSTNGKYSVSWQFVDCPVAGGVKVCTKTGSNQWWLAVQPTNTVDGVESMTINGKVASLGNGVNNYYFRADPTPDTPLERTRITMTSYKGETISTTVSLVAN
ncbi:hypothetical protein ACHHYP_06432, partial [Achlya hypogyna]